MAVYTLLILVALVAQLSCADPYTQKLDTYVRHHSNLMSREFEHRMNEGTKRKVSATNSKNVPAVNLVHHSQQLSALEPSAEPTAEPTAMPTNRPYQSSPGYFFLTESFRHDCSQPVVSYGVPINTCFVQSNYAYKIRVIDAVSWSNVYIDYYGDTECQDLLEGGVPFAPGAERCQMSNSSIVIDPRAKPGMSRTFSRLHISTAPEPPRISANGGGLFEFFENTTTCDRARHGAFLTYASNVCLATVPEHEHDKIDAFSVDCRNDELRMNLDLDNVPNCAGVIGQAVFPNTCEEDHDPNDDDDMIDDDDTYAPEWLNPPPSVSTTPFSTFRDVPIPELSRRFTCQASLVPTITPTAAPSFTAFPTSGTAAVVSFKVKKQVINGFSKAAYDADVVLYGNTLKQSIAATMRGVQASDITDLIVTDGAARTPGALRSTLHQVVSRILQTSSVSLSYTITTTTVYTASQLSTQLQQALASGDFNTVLQLLAFQNGATDLESATSLSTLETDIVPPTDDTEEDKDDEELLSTGAIIGIAIGGAAFLVIVGVLIWYFTSKSSSAVAPASMSTSVTPA